MLEQFRAARLDVAQHGAVRGGSDIGSVGFRRSVRMGVRSP